VTYQGELDDLVAFLRKAEKLIGDSIAMYMFRCGGVMEPVGVETATLAHATGQLARGLAQRLGQLAAAVENARCED
jgi:hypothetical protein